MGEPQSPAEARRAPQDAAGDPDRARREREAHLRAVLDVHPDAVWSIDPEYRLTAFNSAYREGFRAQFGRPPALGEPQLDFAQTASLHALWQAAYDAALGGQPVRTVLEPAFHRRGPGKVLELALCPIVTDGQVTGAACFLRDISEVRAQARALERKNALLDALTRAQARFIGEGGPHFFEDLLESVMELTESAFGFLGEVREEPEGTPYLVATAISATAWSEGSRALLADRAEGLVFRRLDTLFGAVITSRRPVLANDAARDPRASGVPPGHPPIERFMGLPCFSGERLVGMIAVANRRGGYSAADAEFLRPLATTFGGLIEARRTEVGRREAEAALRRAKEAAEAADRAKGEFVASMSHEIRTPLNAVLGLVELALDGAADDDQRSLLRSARANSETLLNLISDILDFSRIDAGRVELDRTPFDLRRVVEDVAEAMALRAHEKGVAVVAGVQARLPAPLVGDPHRVRQVLTNLVSNAVKYTDEGEVVVAVSARPDPADRGRLMVRIEVSDTGCGIPPEEHERIFERFHRVAATATLGGGGTGLGLSITRFLVEAMGGTIGVESRLGAGSRFRVELPLAICARTAEDGPAPWALAGVRVLLAHPPGGHGPWIERLLSTFGADVRWVTTPAEVRRAPPVDVVISSAAVEADAPVIRLAPVAELGRTAPGERRLALPVRRDALIGAVLDAVGLDHLAEPSSPSLRPLPSVSACSVLLVEDHPDSRAIAQRHLERDGQLVELAEDGARAAELAREAAFDVVLMDLHMPGTDGFEATRLIRADEDRRGLPPVPIVAVTAHATAEVRRRCFDLGFDGFVTKPVTRQSLRDAVERFARQGPVALVVDDAADSRRLLVRHLRQGSDLRLREAADGEQALALAERCPPALVLLDATMPGLDGFEVARRLRAQLGPGAVILMVSGRTEPGVQRRAAEAGCDGYVFKPIDRRSLLADIEAHLAARRPGRRGVRSRPPAAAEDAATDEGAETLTVDPDLLDLIPPFLDDRRRDIERIDAALSAGDFDPIARVGHSMRGTGRAYGLPRVSALGEHIEAAARDADAAAVRVARDALARFVETVRVVPAG